MADYWKRPRFPTVTTGYAPRAVDQMLDRLRDAASTGESTTAILESTPLTKVSFGYDMEAVDEYIAALILESEPPPPAEPDGRVVRTTVREQLQTPSGSPSAGTPAPAAQAGEPASAPPPQGLAAAQLQAVQRINFRRSQGRPGYDVQEVERFLDRLEEALREGQDISKMVALTRFGMSRAGYEPENVDRFMDQLAAGESPLPVIGPAAKPGGVALALILAIGIPLLIVVFFVT